MDGSGATHARRWALVTEPDKPEARPAAGESEAAKPSAAGPSAAEPAPAAVRVTDRRAAEPPAAEPAARRSDGAEASLTPGPVPASAPPIGATSGAPAELPPTSGAGRGMFGIAGSGDTSGFGGLVRRQVVVSPTPRPYGGDFDEVYDAL